MTSSLVGSEMCIRDSVKTLSLAPRMLMTLCLSATVHDGSTRARAQPRLSWVKKSALRNLVKYCLM
eukprot:1562172-Prorocentrum_lima.AAC.1